MKKVYPSGRQDVRPLRSAACELKFEASDGFQLELRRRVDDYFETTGKRRRDCPRMYLKTAITFAWFAASYAGLTFLADTWQQAALLAVSLGLSMAAIGFNIQHDGGHQAYSARKWINRLMAMSLDLLGGSSYVWAKKHNHVHHSFSNITGHDDDINIGSFGRLSPHQRRLGFHRLQHFYLWALYGFLPIKWQLYDDFRDVALGRVGAHRMARPQGWDLAQFLGGKLIFLTLAFVIPLSLHSVGAVAAFYLLTSLAQGVVLSVVFQLAHCVEEADFPMPSPANGRIANSWAVHQIETTVDFAQNSRLLSWLIGGLNFQIEHHLFPRICHLHYPAISKVVKQTCADYGIRYVAHETLYDGVSSHYRWLRRMGRAKAEQELQSAASQA
ncbi:MAG TPA: acyl-CoA desaturase [Pirellulales bacterium]|nr:acyl-CoA desaturase [Pirellulales bacterium]